MAQVNEGRIFIPYQKVIKTNKTVIGIEGQPVNRLQIKNMGSRFGQKMRILALSGQVITKTERAAVFKWTLSLFLALSLRDSFAKPPIK